MKDFLKMVFASTLGVMVALVLFTFLSFVLVMSMIIGSSGEEKYALSKNTVLTVELSGFINDRTVTDPFDGLFSSSTKKYSLQEIIEAIQKAKENDLIKGIYLKGGTVFSAGIASLDAIRDALTDFKESGKFVVAYADNYTQGVYYVSSVADKVFINPQGMLDLHGLAATPTFYTGLLEKLGVKVEIFKVGTFKSAVEPYMLNKMSEPNREQVSSYMNSLWSNMVVKVAADRQMSEQALTDKINQGLLFADPAVLLAEGLVDSLLYALEVEEYFEKSLEVEEVKWAKVSTMKSVSWKNKKDHKDKIAILYAEGEITVEETGLFQSNTVISDTEYVKVLRKLKKDEDIKSVVFRINSPGGSGFMSEQIWREVMELKKEKPVVVSMGDVAASGGYYIATAADWIVAQPTTITGSIGVFGMFPVFEGLYGKVGLSTDVVKTHQFADFGDVSRSMRSDEKALMQGYVERFYEVFLTRCAEGRNTTKAAIDSIGQGRVWTGEQALVIGLVDELGTLERAVEVAAERANLEKYALAQYPEKKDIFTQMLEQSMGDMQAKIAKWAMGEVEYKHWLLLKNSTKQDNIQARLPYDF